MNKPILLKSSLNLFISILLTVLYSCSQSNTNQEETFAKTEPEKPVCEVQMAASSLRNSLLAPSENLKLTVSKLHELAESHDHNHDRLGTQAKNMVDEGVKLMNASAYIPSYYFDSLLVSSTRTTVLANTLYAHNQSMDRTKLKNSIEKLEALTGSIGTIIERKLKIDKDACLTNKELLVNQIRLYYATLKTGIAAIESSLDSHCEKCKTNEITFYEDLMKGFREALIKAPTSQYKTVSRTLADIEHTLLELSSAHEPEEAHHTMETLERQMNRLKDELLDITGRSEI